MSLRRTALNVTKFELGGVEYKCASKNLEVGLTNALDDARGLCSRYMRQEPVKRELSVAGELMYINGSRYMTNLNISVFTFGSTAKVADITTATIDITNDVEDGDGFADEWAYPQLVGTNIRVTGEALTPAAAVTSDYMDEALGDFDNAGADETTFVLTMTWDGGSVVMPCRMESAGIMARANALLRENFSVSGEGAPTTYTGSGPLVAAISPVAGTPGSIAYDIETPLRNFSGNLMIESLRLELRNRALISQSIQGRGIGAPSFV